uniref:EH domain-containing protein n=1 Tax=Gallus gallus TaxID=9031 RepID=A0A8V0XGV5_CHICK
MHFKHTSRDGDSTTSLGSLFQCLTTLSVKKFFLIFKLNLPWCNLRPFPLVPQQFTAGISLYKVYYKQVYPTYTGRAGASEAALFFKKSGLSDIILGKIWYLADPEGKGCEETALNPNPATIKPNFTDKTVYSIINLFLIERKIDNNTFIY